MSARQESRNPLREKSFLLALEVLTVGELLRRGKQYELANQVVRCGTSIGANVEEAMEAVSRRDFIHRLSIALKEARELSYWLRLIAATETVDAPVSRAGAQVEEVLKLLTRIIKTSRARYERTRNT